MLTIFRPPKDSRGRPGEPEQTDPRHQKDPGFQPVSPSVMTGPPPGAKPDFTVADPEKPVVSGSTTFGKDLVFDGTVKGSGSIRVEGVFQGTLDVQNEVIIGNGGVVKGDIKADFVTVEGQLNGNVEARQKITINKTGTMKGDIIAPRVVVASGAVYKGRIDMEAASKLQPKEEKTKPRETAETRKTPEPQVKPDEPAKPIPGPPPSR